MITNDIHPRGLSRRGFLQAIALGALAGSTFDTVGRAMFGDVPDAWAAPAAANDGLVVIVTLYGGNDGLNTFVPYADPAYTAMRGAVAIAADEVLPVDGQSGFHPSLPYLASLYRTGLVAAIQGVGTPQSDLSHFSSMASWMRGSHAAADGTGWIGRWTDGLGAGHADLPAASMATSVPLHLIGRQRRSVAISADAGTYGLDRRPVDLRLYDGIRAMAAVPSGRGAVHDLLATTMSRQMDVAGWAAPSFGAALPDGRTAQNLTMAARLLNADIGLRVLEIGIDGFDHHEFQLGKHAALLAALDTGLKSFFATLAPDLIGRTTVVVLSEFGRTPKANASGGTDHGTANTLFVIGGNVRGGTYGPATSLTHLDENQRLIAEVDFRSVYGSIVDGWLGGGGSSVIGGAFEDLRLFRSSPGAVAGPALPVQVVLPAIASGFVPCQPTRVLDTRDGLGGRRAPLGTDETWTLRFDGAGMPASAVAVAMNLTSVNATRQTFVTAWPSGTARPFTANLNPVPGMAVPNLVVVSLGADKSVSLYNLAGSVDLVADVVGWFTPESPVGLLPVTPARLLDTRDGTGVLDAPGPVGPGSTIRLQVTGRGGAPDRCSAAVLNVTVTEPTEPSFVTTWPTGRQRPLAASLNMLPGQTVPNLVIAQIGDDGTVSLYNNGGSTHLVADLLGCFGDGLPGRFVPVTPTRLLDTRDGTGAPAARLGQEPLRLQLAGRSPVPWNGATAVLLNMTIVEPTANTYVTVSPSGAARPLAANLNAVAGQVVPNMVLARLGDGGCVDVFHLAGQTDLVADVMGYFIA